ncbi:glycoside hydrolase family 97 protein [Pedobacter mendelii]|uniref:Retaining alpha-galactosidase n=4 Tax=Pedobacter mendelii TaxID=1908240 RepID=A0ABQ2BHR2_9SPHI|nr:glycoside hydrolase family 97 protein [Pedobacter mendelii]GGI24459.1 retaining alpha-galactosidase [Pedobacter mendelii]
MRIKIAQIFILLNCITAFVYAQDKVFTLKSPNGNNEILVQIGSEISWSVKNQNDVVLAPSNMSLTLATGEVLGENPKIIKTNKTSINTSFVTPIYKRSSVQDKYNQLIIDFKGDYSLTFRAYNDGVAYRFSTAKKGEITVNSEEANFNLSEDKTSLIPYVRDLRGEEQFISSFESLYTETRVSAMFNDSLAFLPLMFNINSAKKAVILEADLEDYPGMFISKNPKNSNSLKGLFAPYPLAEKAGGFNNMNYMVTQRADYIAKTKGTRSFPWRAVVISENDKDLLDNDMVQKLASPSRIADMDWIKPGKVAWDWWNDWNISGVDFKAGINTQTYKYYIDFAAANKVEYVILDEGWSDETDMTKVSDKINLPEIITYAKQKNVGIILWASWFAVSKVMDNAFEQYSRMGVKGFKIDFLDRDDQKMVSSVYQIAKNAAAHKLLIDFHGMYKPTGLQRTYPNVLNFEGVKGLENVKWTPNDDVPKYDVTIPFIRMLAGPMDYTPGAMRNATKAEFKPSNSKPMSQGTRSHQLATFIVFEAPLQMMADSPTAYMKEQESTDFIASIPTVFIESVALNAEVGAYAAIARKHNSDWFIGALNNWNQREITIDFSFLGKGKFQAIVFKDGLNADKDATDYKREIIEVNSNTKLKVNMFGGGGWAAKVYPIN